MQTAPIDYPIKGMLKRLIGHEGSLRRKAIVGGNWQMVRSMLVIGMEMVRAAIFARVLFPDDYGLMALAATVTMLLESFTATGIELMILREKDDFPTRLRAYWTIMFVRGCFLALLCCALSVPVARFYNNPQLIPVICVLSLCFILKGVTGFGREIRQREMDFKRVAIVETVVMLVGLILSLIALFTLRNVWALVGYSLITALGQVAISYVLYPWKPGFAVDPSLFGKMLAFSGMVIVGTLANYFFTSFDVATIGKLLGIHHVGLYARANFLALLPALYFSNLLAPAVLPVLRAADSEKGRLNRVFWTMFSISLVLFSLCGIVLELLSRWVILIVYGSSWLDLLNIYRILIIYGCFKAGTFVVPMIYVVKDKPLLGIASAVVLSGSFAILCVPMTRSIGVEGTAWAVVISGILCQMVSILIVWRFILKPSACAKNPVFPPAKRNPS